MAIHIEPPGGAKKIRSNACAAIDDGSGSGHLEDAETNVIGQASRCCLINSSARSRFFGRANNPPSRDALIPLRSHVLQETVGVSLIARGSIRTFLAGDADRRRESS